MASRWLKCRIKEHSSAIKNYDIKNCAIANRFNEYHSSINNKNRTFLTNVIYKCNGFLDRKILKTHIIINKTLYYFK